MGVSFTERERRVDEEIDREIALLQGLVMIYTQKRRYTDGASLSSNGSLPELVEPLTDAGASRSRASAARRLRTAVTVSATVATDAIAMKLAATACVPNTWCAFDLATTRPCICAAPSTTAAVAAAPAAQAAEMCRTCWNVGTLKP